MLHIQMLYWKGMQFGTLDEYKARCVPMIFERNCGYWDRAGVFYLASNYADFSMEIDSSTLGCSSVSIVTALRSSSRIAL